jgi:probable rRNA maturation factor
MIEVLNRQRRYRIRPRKFRELLESLRQIYRPDNPEVTLAFVDSKTIRALNRRFLKRDRATDVLSFPGEGRSADGRNYLGDIIIGVSRAFEQCLREPHGLETELQDLAIHGFLHLVGFEHGRGIEEEEVRVRRELVKE